MIFNGRTTEVATRGGVHVQFGCGLSAPAGWRNFDASPTLRLQRLSGVGKLFRRHPYPPFPRGVEYGDVVRGLPLNAGSVNGMYCSHVLEHLALEDLRVALRNTYNYIESGGIFRLVVPDLERIIHDYMESDDERAAESFMQSTMLGRTRRERGIQAALRTWLGNSEHLWMWDFKALSCELAEAGFKRIRRASFGDCGDPQFRLVEDPERWDGALGIECAKP